MGPAIAAGADTGRLSLGRWHAGAELMAGEWKARSNLGRVAPGHD